MANIHRKSRQQAAARALVSRVSKEGSVIRNRNLTSCCEDSKAKTGQMESFGPCLGPNLRRLEVWMARCLLEAAVVQLEGAALADTSRNVASASSSCKKKNKKTGKKKKKTWFSC